MRTLPGLLLWLVAAAAAGPPHLVLIVLDDVGFCDVGYCDPAVLTPTMDELARDGVRLGAHYTWNWCAPSRGALLTGRYPTGNGYGGAGSDAGGGDNGSPSALPGNWTLLPELLARAGYRRHAAGKWCGATRLGLSRWGRHLGFATAGKLPSERGFESWLGYLGGAEDHWYHNTSHGGCPGTDLWRADSPGPGGPATQPELYPEYSVFAFTERHVSTIMQHNLSEPLFIYAPYQQAHVPLQVPKRFFDLYAGRHQCDWNVTANGRQGFECLPSQRFPQLGPGSDCGCNRLMVSAMMSALDEAVANISQALRARGMWQDTVLVVMGDNGIYCRTVVATDGVAGGPSNNGHSNSPLRGGKLNWWEGGVRPMAFVWSSLLAPGSSLRGGWYNGTVHEVDWFATFARLAGVSTSGVQRQLDSVDLWPALLTGSTHRTEALIADNILRVGDYKLIAGGGDGQTAGESWRQGFLRDCMLGTGGGWLRAAALENQTGLCPEAAYKLIGQGDKLLPVSQGAVLNCTDVSSWGDNHDKWLCSVPCTPEQPCLYDVVRDPGERRDLAAEMPDMVEAMLARLREHQQGFWRAEMMPDNHRFCTQMKENGGFYGPWI